jgi:hypothetical protein
MCVFCERVCGAWSDVLPLWRCVPGVQCHMLGEGYDNPWIAISVFVHPVKELPVLVQYHGRACRAVPPNVRKSAAFQLTTGLYAYMYYPTEMDTLVKDYQNGIDEKTSGDDGLFIGKSFEDINNVLSKQTSEDAASELVQGFTTYHASYCDAREKPGRGKSWDPVPAEYVADLVANSISRTTGPVQLSVIDFGCGAEYLFEAQLFRHVEVCLSGRERIRHFRCFLGP